jgi:hypothetical protein
MSAGKCFVLNQTSQPSASQWICWREEHARRPAVVLGKHMMAVGPRARMRSQDAMIGNSSGTYCLECDPSVEEQRPQRPRRLFGRWDRHLSIEKKGRNQSGTAARRQSWRRSWQTQCCRFRLSLFLDLLGRWLCTRSAPGAPGVRPGLAQGCSRIRSESAGPGCFFSSPSNPPDSAFLCSFLSPHLGLSKPSDFSSFSQSIAARILLFVFLIKTPSSLVCWAFTDHDFVFCS